MPNVYQCLQRELELLLAELANHALFLVARLCFLSGPFFCVSRDVAQGFRPDANGSLMGCDFSQLPLQPSELQDHRQQTSCYVIVLRNLG